MSKKILITSIGRTATSSINALLAQFSGVISHHEKGKNDPYFLFLSQFDAYQKFTQDYLKDRDDQANRSGAKIYVEVNPYFRFVDHEFLRSKGWSTLFIVRHPKTYLESVYRRKLFMPNDSSFQKLPDSSDPFYEQWPTCSRFEKLCWYYSQVHEFVLNENHPFFRYESLVGEGQDLPRLLNEVGIKDFDVNTIKLPHLNKSGIHSKSQILQTALSRSNKIPDELQWEVLTEAERKTYDSVCRPLLTKLGYED